MECFRSCFKLESGLVRSEDSSNNESGKFNFRSIKNCDLNFSYFPDDRDNFGTSCITVKTRPLNGTVALTFYTEQTYPGSYFNYRNIFDSDSDHEAEMHKRDNPLSRHYHFEINSDDDPDLFIKEYFDKLGFKGNCMKFLYASAKYIYENPSEPGLSFEDRSYSENSGSRSIDLNNQSDNLYIYGPNNLYRDVTG